MKSSSYEICFLLMFLLTPAAMGVGGVDCYDVTCSGSQRDFNSAPIPADFFGPGSDPFDGVIMLQGGHPADIDTRIRRMDDLVLPGPGSVDTVPIEIVQLSLVSCQPIIVTYGRQNPQQWDVSVQSTSSTGSMTVTKTHANGGTFTATLSVQAVFTFTEVGNPGNVKTLVDPQNVYTPVPPALWRTTSPKSNPPCDGNGFWVEPIADVLFTNGTSIQYYFETRAQSSPNIAVDTKQQWNKELQKGRIASLNGQEWDLYMMQWQQYGTPPYPSNIYSEPNLYAWDPNEVCPTDPTLRPEWPDSDGLVMEWEHTQGQNRSAAWKYTYPADPDLTGTVITITVNPPCIGLNTVSLGLQDINGNIRAWHWNVPATLPCGVPTTISIDMTVAPPGPASANPVANGYLNNPAFNITQVTTLLFDENCNWVGGTTAPPPGQTVQRAWNYWYDLIIAPKPVKTTGPLKWSQPIDEISPGVILGWDEKSIRYEAPLMADDWKCEDQRPVTDIHWWGSFLNWMEPNVPSLMPTAFRFGIWTDVPKNPNDCNSFSHPDELIWEYTCSDYTWNFAGYDKDPRKTNNSALATTTTASVFCPTVHDSCFQFNCDIPQVSWFIQPATALNRGRVYWLSIAAVYQGGIIPQFPWGWKTRPKFYNDDAVRITQIVGAWPPNIGAKWYKGEPVEFPRRISWDLAFELTTNNPEPTVPIIDINIDGVVDFVDFAHFANQWLITIP